MELHSARETEYVVMIHHVRSAAAKQRTPLLLL
jgi:hypothetical protein